jgi:hypothetical protein
MFLHLTSVMDVYTAANMCKVGPGDLFFKVKSQEVIQSCGSGMFIPDPDFYPSRISNPGSNTATKKRKGGKICCPTLCVCSLKFYIIENYFNFELAKKRIVILFIQNIVTKLSKYGFGIRDPGSEKPIPDPGSWSQGSKSYRIPDLDPQH